ncbi:cytochrome P450 [Streptomyces diastaticus]|uniref:Cytochrome P450 n=1 Tax=Streptomyces diastaticus subsp. diastaticus TaxID=68040 RepID=A0ABQ1CSX8_STRDI|nr:cytochrome P450 [Streptomyces diastaticus]GFH73235.1 cytochrome P450 [Streptomyces diastaticus subsp. diastaticus]GGU46090.1 cytochrome P450 [Streptomyces diastaticus subsp. diastaticus]
MRITVPRANVPLQDVDLYDPLTFSHGDPHANWCTLRHEEPVFWQQLPDGRGFWSVTKYDDVCRVLGEHESFTSSRGAILKMLGTPDPAGGRQMAVSDPPRHTHVRRPLYQLMTPSALRPQIPRIHEAVRKLLAPMASGDTWDMGAAMTALPMIVSGILMGLPEEDYPDLVRSGLMTVAPDDPEYQVEGGVEATLHQAHHDLFAYFADQVRRRRRKPPPNLADSDLIGRLMTLRVDGSKLSEGEIVSNCYSLLLGANVNTGHAVSAAILHLLDDPAQYEKWASDESLLKPGIREALRWSSPVIHFLRYAVEDVEIRGRKIRKDDGVVAWIPSANRDEDVFTDPFRFDVGRRPNREIAFGHGPHRCIGAVAAQITLELTLREIFARVERFDQAGEIAHLVSNFTAGIKHFPLKVTARR